MLRMRISPRGALYGLRRAKAAIMRPRLRGWTTEQIFADVYRRNVWGGRAGEYHSGAGSDPAIAAEYVAYVQGLVRREGITSVLDLGCGDFRVGRLLTADGVEYTGVDVVRSLVERNQERYGGPRVRFLTADIVSGDLPAAELVLVRQVLQHLTNAQISTVLQRLRSVPFVLVTEHLPHADCRRFTPNKDKAPGPDTRLTVNSGVVIGAAPFDGRPAVPVVTTPLPSRWSRQPEVLRTWLLRNG